ncbi:microcin C ABC transporter permease YejB [Actibacterium sp. 188UL27-1]|uniref:microcin C ABC transporter permease YejB n=1 Tax=Actibacterium sp. 188UL27-1 TaxID=2786961 RepID=UPI0019567F84|nr:ABC transporter permease subunit [Actibacterium sp. 188UL27-1]MBM7069488.1 ABC transporter permease subunit [Actibacterium sp. 188UL27-1]
MAAYIIRRLLLIIPTLLGIMLINFSLIQFVPGGPIEQIIARIDGEGDAFSGIAGGSDAGANEGFESEESGYQGARGLPPAYLERLEIDMGFKRLRCADGYDGVPLLAAEECVAVPIGLAEQFVRLIGRYLIFDFGESYFKSRPVVDLVLETMPVSITLGLWSTLIAYLVSIPLGIRKAVRDGSRFDTWSSGIIIAAYAIPGFLFAILLLVLFAGGSYFKIFPLRGLTSDGFEDMTRLQQIGDYFWHITLPVLASSISGFATLTLLTKNSFMDEVKKQYVITAKAKGLTEQRVLYGHVFRNAMLIVIAGFPAVFVGVFFGGSIIIETLFSLNGLGRLGFEAVVNRDYAIVFATMYVFSLIALIVGLITDLTYVLVDPRIDFESRRT